MSRRANKRKGNAEMFSLVDGEEEEERKEDKRSRLEPAAAAAASSSSAAAAASSSSSSVVAAASSSSSAAAGSSASAAPSAASVVASSCHLRDEVEDVVCAACHEVFECADDAPHLPRTLPCGHLLCAACIRKQLTLTPGRVQCPSDQSEKHGVQEVRIAQSKSPVDGPAPEQSEDQAAAARAPPTIEDWLRQLPPAAELIAALRIQHHLLTQLGQQGVQCSYDGCAADVSHYCPECGDLCAEHERKLHGINLLQSHKAKTMMIRLKAAWMREQKQSKMAGPAAKIRAQTDSRLAAKQQQLTAAQDKLRQLEAQTQQQRREVEANEKAVAEIQQTADQMRAANDSAVLVMEANRLEAEQLRVSASEAARPSIDSTVLNALPDDRVAALQTFLGPDRSLSNATLIYRASRDGFAPKDWWRLCAGKSDTLTLVRVKSNGFVCGAFAPFQWPVGVPAQSAWIADPTGATFLFSLANAHNRAVKLRLIEDRKANAGGAFVDSGPVFGKGADLGLMEHGESVDSPTGNLAYPSSFEFESVADGGAPIVYDKTLLAGDDDREEDNRVDFSTAEIETWQL